MIKETRLADVKFEEAEGKMTLEGYAIVFNQETLIGNEEYGFVESIDHRALQTITASGFGTSSFIYSTEALYFL